MLSFARGTFVVALGHALILGLPLFFLLSRSNRVGIVSSALSGFLIGATPFGLVALYSLLTLESASTGGHPTVVNGAPTLAGWAEYFFAVGRLGLYGLAGGLTFWAAMQFSHDLTGSQEQTYARRRRAEVEIVSIAALLTAVVLTLPSLVIDESCHNLFRGGSHSVRAQLTAELKLSADAWPALARIFADFALSHRLSVRDDKQIRNHKVLWRELSLCNDEMNIRVTEETWLSEAASFRTHVDVFELKQNSSWAPLAKDLLLKIEAKWPGITKYRDAGGRAISIDEAIEGRAIK